ncbi:MAG: hypothetical protein A3J97_12765 [Spirochaetes bacterium RIFOXYC1_FULL_54_7]|nr:MAG: hypothetical protein A3J97_12765 [Spirochaetes bacterium RIFOXYC1_FULL_54_7]
MRSAYIVFILALVALALPLAAQDIPTPIASSPYVAFEKGDGILSLTLGTKLALAIYDPEAGSFVSDTNMYPGFAFALSYVHFLNDNWAFGGDLAGAFIGTLAERRLFMAPLSFRFVRAFNLDPFIIAPTAGLGMAILSLGEDKHIDPLFKFGSSFYWRATGDISYGLNLLFDIVPQFYDDSAQNRTGFFMDATLSVAYHL